MLKQIAELNYKYQWFNRDNWYNVVSRILLFMAFLGPILANVFITKGDTSLEYGGEWYYVCPILLFILILDIFMPIAVGIIAIVGVPIWMFSTLAYMLGSALGSGHSPGSPHLYFLPVEWTLLFLGGVLSIFWGIYKRRKRVFNSTHP